MNIICRKKTCKFNKNFVCQADELNVSQNAKCEMFEKVKSKVDDSSKKIFRHTPKYNQFRAVKNLPICCHADCQFNKCTKCHANGVTINDLENVPYCVTYFRKIEK